MKFQKNYCNFAEILCIIAINVKMDVSAMNQPVYQKIAELAEEPAAVERSIAYMTKHMGSFLKKNERVLICFDKKDNAACHILEETVLGCGCEPVWLGDDRRWVTMLKIAFTMKCNCIVAPPLTLLGLSKVAKYMGTPLYARNVLMAGYPTTVWMVNGVRQGLDCMAWGCFDPGPGAVIAGFTCPQLDGVHIRSDEYCVDVVDEAGRILPLGEAGRVVLYPKADPSLRFAVGDRARLETKPCSCGCNAPKLVDIETVKNGTEEMSDLGESLHYWSSILDCRMGKTEYGLELELVVFQGEKLPKLPSAAKLVVRPFNPETDEPFGHQEVLKKRFSSEVTH